MRKRSARTVSEWDASRSAWHLDSAGKNRQFLTALARGLAVLECYTASDLMLSNDEIAERLGMSKPTVSRITYTLTSLGYLSYRERSGRYQLGPAVLSVAQPLLNPTGFRAYIRPHLQALAAELGSMVSLAGASGTVMVYLECFRSANPVVLNLTAGAILPMGTTAAGRAYVASLPAKERDSLLARVERERGKNALDTPEDLRRAIRDMSAYGYCVSLGEWHDDVNAAAVPLRMAADGELLVLVCGGPASILTEPAIRKTVGPGLVAASRGLTSGVTAPPRSEALEVDVKTPHSLHAGERAGLSE